MRSRHALTQLACATALLATLGRPAAADVVVFEAYGGARPADASELLAPLFAELHELGYVADPAALETRIESRVSRTGSVLSSSAFVEAIQLVSRGYEHWLNGEFGKAIADLESGLEMFRSKPASVAMRPKYRESVYRALVGLSLAHARLGHSEEATSAMAELLRSFPDLEISRTEYGPEPRELYRRVKAELDERGLGSVRVVPDDESVLVFVNGRYVGTGEQAVEDLYPGRYRIFTRRAKTPGRVYSVEVTPGTEQRLTVDWGRDASLRSRKDFVGFELASEAEREAHEPEYATSLASKLDATGVVVVGIRDYRGRRSIVGTVYNIDTGNPVRTGALALEPATPGRDASRALARFLAGGRAAPGIIVGGAPRAGSDEHTRKSSKWAWMLVGTGVLTMAGGATLIAIDDPEIQDGERQETYRNSLVPGIIMTAGGAVLTGIGVYLWRRNSKDDGKSRTAVVPTLGNTWGLAITGTF